MNGKGKYNKEKVKEATELLIGVENLIENCEKEGVEFAYSDPTHQESNRYIEVLQQGIPDWQRMELNYLVDMANDSIQKIEEAKKDSKNKKSMTTNNAEDEVKIEEKDPFDVLKMRLAKGEISLEEFNEIKEHLD